MSFVRTILGDVPADGLRCCGAHEHTIIDAPYIAEKHSDFLLDNIDAACMDLREFRDAGGGWVIDTMPTGAGRCALKLATVSRLSGVHIVCPTGMHLPLYYPPDHPMLSMHREELADVFLREIVDAVRDETGPLPYRAGVIKVAGGHEQLTPHQREAFTAETAAGQHAAQAVLAAAQEFFEVGRGRTRWLRSRAPRAFTPSAGSPGSAALIAPWHRLSPRCAGPGGLRRLFRVVAVIGEASSRYNAAWAHATRRRITLKFDQCMQLQC